MPQLPYQILALNIFILLPSLFQGQERQYFIFKKQFLKDVESYSKYSGTSSENEQTISSNPTWINLMFKKNKQSSLDQEIKSDLADNISSEHTDPIYFWSAPSQNDRFPCLSMMAKTYFSIPSTSTPSGRCFSGGCLICHHTHCSLSIEKLSALLCLNSWLKNRYTFNL